jgi:hypothetical protein
MIRLIMNDTSISDVSPVAAMDSLRYLAIERTNVSTLAPLAHHPTLDSIDVTDPHITEGALAVLQESLPSCDIHFNGKPYKP